MKGKSLLFLNTHFDHRGKVARHEAAKLIRSFLTKQAKGSAVIVAGDFNTAPQSDPHKALVGEVAEQIKLIDTYASLHKPKPNGGDGTFHGFTGKVQGQAVRIDWVLCSPEFKVRSAAIDRYHEEGRYPSDHFPVTAVLEWGE